MNKLSLILWLVSIAIFAWYFILTWIKFGIQKSISHTYTLFPENKFSTSYYTWFMWGISVPIIIIAGIHGNTIGVFAGMLLCFDGAARTGSGDKMTQFIHNWGAQGGIVLGTAMTIQNGYWGLAILFGLFCFYGYFWDNIVLKFKWKKLETYLMRNVTTWVEVAAFVTIMIGIFLEYIV